MLILKMTINQVYISLWEHFTWFSLVKKEGTWVLHMNTNSAANRAGWNLILCLTLSL